MANAICDSLSAGDFGTFVVHGGNEEKTSSSFYGSPEVSSLSVKADILTDLRYLHFSKQIDTFLLPCWEKKCVFVG